MDKYSHFCYDFSDTMRVCFPLLYMIELQNSLQQQVEEHTKELKEEKNNSEKLLIELTQALATTFDAKDKYTIAVIVILCRRMLFIQRLKTI